MDSKIKEDGSTFVEAAIVLPVTILAIIAVILIVSFLTHCAFFQVNIHGYLRREEGIVSKTRVTYKTYEELNINDSYFGARRVMRVEEQIYGQGGALLNQILKKDIRARVYKINEKEIIMYNDFFKKI